MVLFEEAVTRGLVADGYMERLNFAAAAEHARVRGSRNPCGLFFAMVSRKLWKHITDGDEEAVRRKLTRYLYGEGEERRGGGGERSSDEDLDDEVLEEGLDLEAY